MAEYKAFIHWTDTENKFHTGRYSRAHSWAFDGGITVKASSSPHVVRLPFSAEDALDPEEALVASVSSCHMLTFLFLAGNDGWDIESYEDKALGFMEKNEKGIPWISRIKLEPKIRYRGESPQKSQLEDLHHRAHDQCYIANTIKSEVLVIF
ncbi:OsmC family protein [Spirochaeta cellobiosiphila]|uniref:OsmC family protein n=1 Tax=Spirochaeta cellobiosiphila TaxID=504483 RepID=UPI00041F741C|nr:OsmC family protein [Spirochaeta cellobiosiphila]